MHLGCATKVDPSYFGWNTAMDSPKLTSLQHVDKEFLHFSPDRAITAAPWFKKWRENYQSDASEMKVMNFNSRNLRG